MLEQQFGVALAATRAAMDRANYVKGVFDPVWEVLDGLEHRPIGISRAEPGRAQLTARLWSDNGEHWRSQLDRAGRAGCGVEDRPATSRSIRSPSNHYMLVGSTGVQYTPTTGTWSGGGTTLLLQGADYSSIGFHNAIRSILFSSDHQSGLQHGPDHPARRSDV
jgi:hypothetical protein